MSLSQFAITDLYFTPDNQVLLRIRGMLLSAEQIANTPQTKFKKLLNSDAVKKFKTENSAEQNKEHIKKICHKLLGDCHQLQQKAAAAEAVDEAVMHDGYVYRINRSETLEGRNYSIRRLDPAPDPLEKLGLHPGVIPRLRQLSEYQGLILAAGATGSGKTTTISSILRTYLKATGEFAYTIEDPPEYNLSGSYDHNGSQENNRGYCIQTRPAKGDWAAGLRNALRSRPKYILVGEIRDSHCASEVLRAANSGHIVLSTIHAQSVPDSLAALVKLAAPLVGEQLARDQLSQGILATIHQSIERGELRARLLFAGPISSAVRAKVADGKFVMLANDIERQMIRIQRDQDLFN